MNRKILTEEWCFELSNWIKLQEVNNWEEWKKLKHEIREKSKQEEKQWKQKEKQEESSLQKAWIDAMETSDPILKKETSQTWKNWKQAKIQETWAHWLCKWKLEGERTSKQLGRMIKGYRERKHMKRLKYKGLEIIGSGVVDICEKFYSDLFIANKQSSRLRETWIKRIRKWSVKLKPRTWKYKFETVFKRMKKQKSPGEDGLPVELYVKCPELVEILQKLWIQTSKNWSNSQAVIFLLFKKGERDNINNWRPISLILSL